MTSVNGEESLLTTLFTAALNSCIFQKYRKGFHEEGMKATVRVMSYAASTLLVKPKDTYANKTHVNGR